MSMQPISGRNQQTFSPIKNIQENLKGNAEISDTYVNEETKLNFPDKEKVLARLREHGVPEPLAANAVSDNEEPVNKTSLVNKTLAGFFIGTTLFGVAGCKQSPPPIPGEEPTSITTELSYILISTKDEIELGKQVAPQIEKETKIWQNKEAQAKINKLGKSLADTSVRKDIPYTFKLLDTDMINAFALPGGHVYVTRGLYQEFKDDNELLFIMGHEVGHIEDRDSIKRIERDVAFRALIRILTEKKGDTAGVAAELAANFTDVRFSQSDEYQADAASARHMIRNGVNPWYGVRAMEHLKKLEKQSPNLIQKLFSTHPPTSERVEHLKDIAKDHPKP